MYSMVCCLNRREVDCDVVHLRAVDYGVVVVVVVVISSRSIIYIGSHRLIDVLLHRHGTALVHTTRSAKLVDLVGVPSDSRRS